MRADRRDKLLKLLDTGGQKLHAEQHVRSNRDDALTILPSKGRRRLARVQRGHPDDRGVIRTYVVDAPRFRETIDHGVCDPGLALRIRMRQHELERVAPVDDLAA